MKNSHLLAIVLIVAFSVSRDWSDPASSLLHLALFCVAVCGGYFLAGWSLRLRRGN